MTRPPSQPYLPAEDPTPPRAAPVVREDESTRRFRHRCPRCRAEGMAVAPAPPLVDRQTAALVRLEPTAPSSDRVPIVPYACGRCGMRSVATPPPIAWPVRAEAPRPSAAPTPWPDPLETTRIMPHP